MDLNDLLGLFSQDYFMAVIRMSCPIALVAIGEVLLEKSGVINLGVEGMMMFGAFFSVLGSYWFQNPVAGLLVGIVAGVIASLLFGFFTIHLRSNQIVTGTAFIILGYGLTSFLSRVIWGIRVHPVTVERFTSMPIPGLSAIPVIGPILFNQSPLVYLTYIIIIAAPIFLYKTTMGLKIRAVGENPKAADTAGINVIGWRYACVIINGILCAIGGAILSISQLNVFVEGMSNGRGFFALAAVIFGRWNPLGATLGAFLFGASDAFQMRLQASGVSIPDEFLISLPYIFTLLAVIFFEREASRPPAALTQPYTREDNN